MPWGQCAAIRQALSLTFKTRIKKQGIGRKLFQKYDKNDQMHNSRLVLQLQSLKTGVAKKALVRGPANGAQTQLRGKLVTHLRDAAA